MDDEFKLCWKNFQDNIASGFQNLYDRGDLVDVTLACDGKLLHAHKIVLAICSPYFQEIFITNPCKHPIIILKDVHFNIMCELLEFMYQGVVNVKHTELQSFMKIGQLLQIKGLATNSSTSALSEKFPNDIQNAKNLTTNLCSTDSITSSNVESEPKIDNDGMSKSAHLKTDTTAIEANISPSSSPTPLSTNQQAKHTPDTPNSLQSYSNLKRNSDFNTDSLLIHSKKQLRRSISHDNSAGEQSDEHENGGGGVGGMEHVSPEDFFLSAIPHISMGEGSNRYELGNVKREGDHSNSSSSIPPSMRSSFGSQFGFEYNLYKNASGSNTGADFSSDLHLPNDYSKNFGNHMDIPPSSNNITMLSSTSLLHGNCVFNRNNTVATQQGMKTYWLCKSYRISMCRARCITHQGRVISATGVHNHPPHMRNGPPPTMPGGGYFNDSCTSSSLTVSAANSHCGGISASNIPPSIQSGAVAAAAGGISSISNVGGSGGFSNLRSTSNMFPHSLNITQQQNAQATLQQQQQQLHQQSKSPPQLHSHPHLTQSAHPNLMIQQHTIAPLSNVNNNNSLIFSHSGATTNLTPPISQTQSSVIQNMMQNVNIMHLPTMMNAVATPHSPRVRDSSNLNSNQVLTSGVTTTRQSPHSPSNLNDHNPHQHQQQRCNSIESAASNGRTMKSSPLSHSHHSSEHRVGGSGRDRGLSTNITEQVVLVQNAAELSPNYMHSPGDIDVDRNSSSLATRAADVANESRCNETQIIDSITISPGTGHNFKIEDM